MFRLTYEYTLVDERQLEVAQQRNAVNSAKQEDNDAGTLSQVVVNVDLFREVIR